MPVSMPQEQSLLDAAVLRTPARLCMLSSLCSSYTGMPVVTGRRLPAAGTDAEARCCCWGLPALPGVEALCCVEAPVPINAAHCKDAVLQGGHCQGPAPGQHSRACYPLVCHDIVPAED